MTGMIERRNSFFASVPGARSLRNGDITNRLGCFTRNSVSMFDVQNMLDWIKRGFMPSHLGPTHMMSRAKVYLLIGEIIMTSKYLGLTWWTEK